MRVGIATDHGGFGLKQEFVAHLRTVGHEVIDFGAHSLTPQVRGTMGNGTEGVSP